MPRLQRDRHTQPLWATETSGLTTGCSPRMAGKEREGKKKKNKDIKKEKERLYWELTERPGARLHQPRLVN